MFSSHYNKSRGRHPRIEMLLLGISSLQPSLISEWPLEPLPSKFYSRTKWAKGKSQRGTFQLRNAFKELHSSPACTSSPELQEESENGFPLWYFAEHVLPRNKSYRDGVCLLCKESLEYIMSGPPWNKNLVKYDKRWPQWKMGKGGYSKELGEVFWSSIKDRKSPSHTTKVSMPLNLSTRETYWH